MIAPSRLISLLSILCFWALFTVTASAANEYSSAAGGYAKYLEIPGAQRAGSDSCSGCHADAAPGFHRGPHGAQDLECEDCHGPASLHVQSGDVTKIISYKQRGAEESNGACLACHAKTAALLNWFSSRHQADKVRCIDCHRVHAETSRLASIDEQVLACESCHKKQEAEGMLPYHHPFREGKMGCGDCHDPHGGTASNMLRQANLNQLCFGCHSEFQGPFTYQHAPVNESCLKCHTPHGSVNPKLLVVSQPALCLQCHAAHHNGSGIPLLNACTDCHSSIHGSDVPSATGGSVFIDKP